MIEKTVTLFLCSSHVYIHTIPVKLNSFRYLRAYVIFDGKFCFSSNFNLTFIDKMKKKF